ncbi:hypothetical protein PAECIP111891_07039 [Paenibacillus allorhizoplanae]|uniref:Uncharacterized protein n=1 Tax=Paenibacillus allorhizoplanae TaxID=2905648 RepID=A0ABN8HDK5_9BACL|nr:hypothetical protein [Paenibacillus allorhizoplanae]CAH1232551.1 hypothetical protein PAECIP111891_07039 [Paenibacillus allorhizoplanae]
MNWLFYFALILTFLALFISLQGGDGFEPLLNMIVALPIFILAAILLIIWWYKSNKTRK